MSPLVFLAVCLAGGVGAALRFVADGWIRSLVSMRFPFATTVINVTGSFVLGLVTGAAGAHAVPAVWSAVLGAGLLGGYTTFSTASVEAVRLLLARDLGLALRTGFGMLAAGVLAALLGLWLGALA
ncbi:fluoride efflux transporter FluC [Raineyella fluvialis]|uniref:Fluoride-specific ion channel FluC n=1 Tax=Raineyella fluvialis TaxID=2662261 RepID=A0A5Q2FAU6_9ACTN|nr:CrcB family protein [Raineyella fluvialis]QGF23919.1 chromosome condensation protein CrcB [Raineyella fluvialis]